MILWNLGSWYDVANCCNNCFGYGMNSSTVSDCNWLRATTGCYYVQGYGSKKAKAVPCAASTRFVIFCMIFQCWNTCASCIPLVYFSLCSRSSHCMGGLALHSRFFLLISFSFFFNMQLCRRELLCFEEEGLLDTGQFFARAIVQWPALWSH